MSEIKKYGKSYSRFEEILKEKSITPYRVATDLKFSPMLLSDWKNDKSKPKLDTMILIANYLDVPVTDFSDLEIEQKEDKWRSCRPGGVCFFFEFV